MPQIQWALKHDPQPPVPNETQESQATENFRRESSEIRCRFNGYAPATAPHKTRENFPCESCVDTIMRCEFATELMENARTPEPAQQKHTQDQLGARRLLYFGKSRQLSRAGSPPVVGSCQTSAFQQGSPFRSSGESVIQKCVRSKKIA